MDPIRLITLDPGHFHAALVQKEMYPEVSPRVSVFAPLGNDLVEHLARIARFNTRPARPARWELDIHAGPDFLGAMLGAPPGDVVVLAGRNRNKIDYILRSLEAGLHVLADKPWVITPDRLPDLASALETAARRGLVAYDIMTERYEVTSMLQRELVNDPEVFGAVEPGTPEEPGVYMKSVHHIMKLVDGEPLRRPAWFFDIGEEGEGLADVGTHLVDLAQWTLFPEESIDPQGDIALLQARRWPTVIDREGFGRVTGQDRFPEYLAPWVEGRRLEYFCNNQVTYALRGVHIRLDVLWDWEAPPGGGDTHYAVYRGSRARIEVRQETEASRQPELYVAPAGTGSPEPTAAAVRARIGELQGGYPGVAVEPAGKEFHIRIPPELRLGHEAHFAQVTRRFLDFLTGAAPLPAWEQPNMMAKYHVTTRGVELSRR
jgi:predicted dehydrogenase